jgi:hypothetical protein
MSKLFQLTVSIVLYNTDYKEVANVLETLTKSGLKIKTFLVDNSPQPSVRQYSDFGNLEYIYIGKNIGFGAGHNIAISKSTEISEYHLVLNADVHFNPDILIKMYDYMKANKDLGMMGPKVHNPDGSLQFSAKLLPTPVNLLTRRFIPIKTLRDKLDTSFELKNFEFDRIIEVPFLLGCFLFINTNVFKVVSGFDERFFMYMEDVDLTRRIQKYYKTIYYPHVSIYHEHGRGSYKDRKLLKFHLDSSIKYFNKWGWIYDKERKAINRKTLMQF